jgi:bifunctional oligoribonuclease and PAP phosphatase NrnA
VIASPSFFYSMKFETLKNIIEENDSFLLTTHVNPDADAIGSEMAMYYVLKSLGKVVHIINHSSTPYNLEFLDSNSVIQKFDKNLHNNLLNEVDVLIALDFNKVDRTVSMQKYFSESTKIKVCVDHHQDPEDFVNHYFVDDNYAATGHIIYDFIKQTNIVELNYDIAYQLYAAIMTDTGSFRFERTTPQLHRIIAELLETGVNPGEVYDKLYDQSKISKIKLLGRALDTLTLVDNDKIGYMYLTQDTFKETGALESDTDNFVNYPLSIENVLLSLFYIELKDGFKISFRSKGKIPVNSLAAKYGGGGHRNAAGARFHDQNMMEKLQDILNTTKEFFNNYNQEDNV